MLVGVQGECRESRMRWSPLEAGRMQHRRPDCDGGRPRLHRPCLRRFARAC